MIHELLMVGEENAKTARDLARIVGTKPREISRMIERERRQGKTICASVNSKKPGYFLPKDKADFAAYCRRLEHRYKEVGITLMACEESLEGMDA